MAVIAPRARPSSPAYTGARMGDHSFLKTATSTAINPPIAPIQMNMGLGFMKDHTPTTTSRAVSRNDFCTAPRTVMVSSPDITPAVLR